MLLAFDLNHASKSKVEMYADFIDFLITQYDKGQPVTLIVDEAQHLGPEYLEQLRMLSNVNTEKGLLLQTILVGQPELWDILRRSELRQFAQRISYDYHLGPLESSEVVGEYIMHRIRAVGGNEELFDADTYPVIYKTTRGIPRLINLLCDTALIYGFAKQAEKIDLNIVQQVLADKRDSFAPFAEPSEERPTPSQISPLRPR